MPPTGTVALVTGGTRGLGRALTLDLARRGFTVYATGRDPAALAALADLAGDLPVVPVPADVTDPDANEALVARIVAEHGGLDVLVHNAGMLGPRTTLETIPLPDFRAVLDANVVGPFDLHRRTARHLRPGAGVLFLSSGVGVVGRAEWGAYAVSKFAIEGLGQIAAAELAPRGVRVFVIDPGAMRTAMRAAAYPAEDPQTLRTPEDNTAPFLWALLEAGPEYVGTRIKAQSWVRPG